MEYIHYHYHTPDEVDIAQYLPGFRSLSFPFIGFQWLLLILLLLAICSFYSSIKQFLLCSGTLYCLPTFVIGIYFLAVSCKGGGNKVPGTSYKEYHVESYSKWMQNKVNNITRWEIYYKKALVDEHVCRRFTKDFKRDSLDAFHKRKLSPYESGCCKPPEECSFNYTSPAVWVKPEIGNYSNVDCNRWDNDQKTLCFNCQSCKAALLDDVTGNWFTEGIYAVVIGGIPSLLVTLIVLISLIECIIEIISLLAGYIRESILSFIGCIREYSSDLYTRLRESGLYTRLRESGLYTRLLQ